MKKILAMAGIFLLGFSGTTHAATIFAFETSYVDFTDEPEHILVLLTTDSERFGDTSFQFLCSSELKAVSAVIGIHFNLQKRVEVKYRLDKNPPVSADWLYHLESTQAISNNSRDFALAEQMLYAESLVVQVANNQATFDLTEGREEIQQFLDACATLP